MEGKRYVMVTTEFRGVFMGQMEEESGSRVVLRDAQNCIRWSVDEHGVFGLAAYGPGEECRIGPVVPRLVLRRVTSVTDCTPEAVKRWRTKPWSK